MKTLAPGGNHPAFPYRPPSWHKSSTPSVDTAQVSDAAHKSRESSTSDCVVGTYLVSVHTSRGAQRHSVCVCVCVCVWEEWQGVINITNYLGHTRRMPHPANMPHRGANELFTSCATQASRRSTQTDPPRRAWRQLLALLHPHHHDPRFPAAPPHTATRAPAPTPHHRFESLTPSAPPRARCYRPPRDWRVETLVHRPPRHVTEPRLTAAAAAAAAAVAEAEAEAMTGEPHGAVVHCQALGSR